MQTTEYIWFDGKMVPWDQAQVHVLTHALHYGDSVFEGIRAYDCGAKGSAVFRLKEHAQRLVNSAKILRMKMPYTAEQICDAVIETLKANKMKAAYIRPLTFVGYKEMGVFPGANPVQTIIACWPWGAYLGPEALEKGIRIRTSSFNRLHPNTLMSKAKAGGNYVNSILAKVEAVEDGYDEAVMLDTTGLVSEAYAKEAASWRDLAKKLEGRKNGAGCYGTTGFPSIPATPNSTVSSPGSSSSRWAAGWTRRRTSIRANGRS